jgi:hypothetical protein
MPFYGRAHVAYVPQSGQVVGLSKFARITQVFSARLQTPDALASQLAVGALCSLPALFLLSSCSLPALFLLSSFRRTSTTRYPSQRPPRNAAAPVGAETRNPGLSKKGEERIHLNLPSDSTPRDGMYARML